MIEYKKVINVKINDTDFKLYVPKNENVGLSKTDKSELCSTCGMIFYFPSLNPAITMKDTKLALDIVFVDGETIVDIVEGVPFSKDLIQGEGDKVIEFLQGTTKKYNINIGDKMKFNSEKNNSTKTKNKNIQLSSLVKLKKGGKSKKVKYKFYKTLDSFQQATPIFSPSVSGKERNKLPMIKYQTGGIAKAPVDMFLLDENGIPQMKLQGEERIFSRIDTRKIIKLAKYAKSEEDLIKLGDYVAKVIYKQDYINKPEYVSE